ncbi:pentatricopeptide repeat-containing protein At2g13600-like [Rutidosis leptorrhynchoides]|uniref:pentatricopeptide repeat-containing protein At2g13600-like n=1 Tax=Rutidosis leptorrhynchoides TaxID=125765 RepID=UPI003A995FC8
MQSLKSLLQKTLYGQALKISTYYQNSKLTNTIYSQFIKSNTLLNPFQSASLITHFTRSGELSRATYLLRHTENPDIVVFNALLSCYARYNQTNPAFELFTRLRRIGLEPDEVSFSNLIKCCNNLNQLKVVHLGLFKLGFEKNVFLISGLIENYFKYECVDLGEKCFEECVCFDGVIWSVMINGYVKNGDFDKGRQCFVKMKDLGFEFNEFSLSCVVGAVFDVHEGEQIHGLCVKRGYLCGCSMYLNNAIMVMYGKCGYKNNAVKVFDEMPERDVVSWTGRIAVSADCLQAFEMFKCCITKGYEINEYAFINVLSHVESFEMVERGKQVHTIVLKSGYLVANSVCNVLISMYAKSGLMHDARQVFDEMVFRDFVSWNSLISGYSHNHLYNQAIETFSRMQNSSIQPNEYTFASILELLSNLSSLKLAMQIHSLILKLGFIYTDLILCHLITTYGKCNGIDKSERLFSEINTVDVVHVNALAGVYDHHGCYTDVQSLFYRRWNLSLEVDIVTFSVVLKSCGALSDLHQAKSIHSSVIKTAIIVYKFIESAIIDVYCKCGSINDAENVFGNGTKCCNLVAWNAMIMGYAQFGCYNKANDLLTKMAEFGMKPDEITYLGVLSSCSHAGLVSEARYHLNSMFNLYGVVPCLEHYACVVDVLGKVGKLDDAKKTIDDMAMNPDARIWQILLSACSIYKNVDIGTVAARELARLQPENESSFVLLSNIYASAGMWSDVRQVRKEMKDKIVVKEAGCSWIQVKGSVHYFFADDTSHNMELHTLINQMLQIPKKQDNNITILS